MKIRKEYFWVPREMREKDASQVGLIQLAFPIILESLLRSTVGMVDVAFLSRISDTAVSAVSIANQFIMFCMIIAISMATGATVCINQAIGMQNNSKVNLFATIGVCANAATGLLFGALFLFIPEVLLKIMRMDQEAITSAVIYMRITGGFMILSVIEIILVNLCRSLGMIKAPLIINLISNLVNVVGNYLAIFHADWFGGIDPVAGVAVATVLSRFVALLIALYLVRKAGIDISLSYLKPFPKENIKLVLSIGIPGGLNNMAYSLSQIVTTSIITMLGLTIVAAKVYVDNIVQYVAIIGMSFSSASALMVGYRLGAGKIEEANEVRAIVTKIALLSNGVISLLLILVRIPLLKIFTQDQQIILLASAIFFIDFFVELGRALNNSLAGALQAAGDVTFQLIVNQGSAWIIAVGGAYLFGIVLGLGLNGVWIAFACDELIRGTILLFRWRSGKWIENAKAKRKVIASEDMH